MSHGWRSQSATIRDTEPADCPNRNPKVSPNLLITRPRLISTVRVIAGVIWRILLIMSENVSMSERDQPDAGKKPDVSVSSAPKQSAKSSRQLTVREISDADLARYRMRLGIM
jgi:hypothetical protein